MDKYREFVEAMIEEEAVVSGSFIIQMVLNEKWEDSDIDIFISLRINPKLPEKYASIRYGHLFTLVEHVIYSDMTPDDYDVGMGPYIHPENDEDLSDGGRLCANGMVVRYRNLFGEKYPAQTFREYPIFESREDKLMKFQIITLRKCDLKSFIHESFDFDICKNTFQYVKVSSDMTNLRPKMKLTLCKPLGIVDRITKFKSTTDLRVSLARCNKYLDRGFKFYQDPSIDSKVKERFDKLIAERNGCDLDSK
jgi:hypothetical protein